MMKTKKNKAAVALGRRGGEARARKLSATELSRIGRKGAQVRWKNKSIDTMPTAR
jgi:hypothetical protein